MYACILKCCFVFNFIMQDQKWYSYISSGPNAGNILSHVLVKKFPSENKLCVDDLLQWGQWPDFLHFWG